LFCPIGDRAWFDGHVPVADPYVRWTHPWHYPSNGEFTLIHIRESILNGRHPAAVRLPRSVAVHNKFAAGPCYAALFRVPAQRLLRMQVKSK
jgi:hypothetical protein